MTADRGRDDEDEAENAADDRAAGRGAVAQTEISGAEAIERLKKGERLFGLRIVNIAFNREISYRIDIKNCVLVRPHFNATFTQPVEIVNARLEKPAFERKCRFDQGLNLAACTLFSPSFRQVQFRQTVRLDHVKAKGAWRMNGCRFHGPLRFWEGELAGWLNVKDCVFEGPVDLRSMKISEGVALEDCVFEDEFLFRGTAVAKKTDFGQSEFRKLLDLSKAKLADYVYLERIRQGPEQRFAFGNALAERIHVKPEQLEGRLATEQAGDFEGAALEYGLLKRIFSDLHRYESEDWAFHRFKICRRRAQPRSWARPWTKLGEFLEWLFLDLGCGYGTNPLRAMGMGLVIILAFGGLYALGIDSFKEVDDLVGGSGPKSVANRLVFGLTTSVAMFTAGFTGDQLQSGSGWMLLALVTEALLGTVLWGFFIVAFSRKVIR